MPEKSTLTHPIGVESIYPGVAVITLNRPERRNALSIAMLEQLVHEIDRLANDLETRVAAQQPLELSRPEGPAPCFPRALIWLRHQTPT